MWENVLSFCFEFLPTRDPRSEIVQILSKLRSAFRSKMLQIACKWAIFSSQMQQMTRKSALDWTNRQENKANAKSPEKSAPFSDPRYSSQTIERGGPWSRRKIGSVWPPGCGQFVLRGKRLGALWREGRGRKRGGILRARYVLVWRHSIITRNTPTSPTQLLRDFEGI